MILVALKTKSGSWLIVQDDRLICALSCIEPRTFVFFSFIFLPTYPLGRVARAAAQRGLEIPHGQQQPQTILLAQPQDGTMKGRRCKHSTWFLGDLLAAFPCVYPARLASSILPWGILDKCQRNWDLSIRRRSGSIVTGLREFYSCAHCHEVSHRERLTFQE